MSDPVVLQALAEIKEVLKKYDVAGHVVTASQENVEFELHLPTWVCAYIDENEGTLRFKSIRGDRSEQEQQDEQMRSACLMLGLRDVLMHQAAMLIKLGEMLEDKLGVKSGALENMRKGKAPEVKLH